MFLKTHDSETFFSLSLFACIKFPSRIPKSNIVSFSAKSKIFRKSCLAFWKKGSSFPKRTKSDVSGRRKECKRISKKWIHWILNLSSWEIVIEWKCHSETRLTNVFQKRANKSYRLSRTLKVLEEKSIRCLQTFPKPSRLNIAGYL